MRAPFARSPRRHRDFGVALLATISTLINSNTLVEEAIAQPPQQSPIANDTTRYAKFVAEAAHRFGLPAAWIRAVIAVESRGNPHAVSRAGAMGLMQLMPDTWQFERAQLKLGSDPFDPRDNILAGSDYLRAMHARYGAIGMLAAYNAGPARFDAYRRGARPLPTETLAYVQRLAPVVTGDAAIIVSASTTVDPLAWTRAPLFVTRSRISSVVGTDSHTARPGSNERSTSFAAQPHINASLIATNQSVDSVFVALGGEQS